MNTEPQHKTKTSEYFCKNHLSCFSFGFMNGGVEMREAVIRHDFTDMPPREFLMQIMNELVKVYCWLWEKRNRVNRINMSWGEVTRLYHKNHFRTSLRKLHHAGLLSYAENIDGVEIEVVGWDEVNAEGDK